MKAELKQVVGEKKYKERDGFLVFTYPCWIDAVTITKEINRRCSFYTADYVGREVIVREI